MYSYKRIPDHDAIARELLAAETELEGPAAACGLEVAAYRRTSASGRVEDGLWVGDSSIDVFEPVRRRRRGGWEEVETVQEAAALVRRFLSERPDLRG